MYEIRAAGAKGLGVFSQTRIPRGTRIFSERPLLSISHAQNASDIYTASTLLSSKDRLRLLDLSSHITRELTFMRWNQALCYTLKSFASSVTSLFRKGNPALPFPKITSLKEHVTILSIFRSNAFALGPSSAFKQAVFTGISRINHSCIPNAQGNFHEERGVFNVHATRDIEVDEELTINYSHEHGALRDSRQEKLLDGYGFNCDCPACDLSTVAGVKGEKARVGMLEMLGKYANAVGEGEAEKPEEELRMIQAFIRLLESEGIAGREVSVLYFEAANLNKKLGNLAEALESAERGLDLDRDCLGTDHEHYQEALKVVQELKQGL